MGSVGGRLTQGDSASHWCIKQLLAAFPLSIVPSAEPDVTGMPNPVIQLITVHPIFAWFADWPQSGREAIRAKFR
jgi:hypothetical protein